MHESDSQAPSTAAEAAATRPFGVSDLFALSLNAIRRPTPSFRAALLRPAPTFASSSGLALIYCAVAIALNLLHARIANPRFLEGYAGGIFGLMTAAALGVCLTLWLLVGGSLYVAGRLLAGRGEFSRGLQGATTLAVIAPILAVCNRLPFGFWLAPALLIGWLSCGVLEGLFNAPAISSRAVSGLLAVACAGGLTGARSLADRAPEIETAALLAAPGVPIGADLSRLQAAEAPRSPAALQSPAASIQDNALRILDGFGPLLNNPRTMEGMNASQKAQFKVLKILVAKLHAELVAGKSLTPDQMNEEMTEIQKLVFKVMVGQAMTKKGVTATDVMPPARPDRESKQ